MAKRKSSRSSGRGSSRGRAPSLPAPSIARKSEEDRTKTVYKVKVPKELRDDPKAIAKYLEEHARGIHGGGGKAYRDQHFMMTFSGTMYEEDDEESEKMGRATFGTYANRNLKTVSDELASRIQALIEGETPRQAGPKSKYGYFASGVSEVAVVVMERANPLPITKGKSTKGTYEGSREIDGEPWLDIRTKDGLYSIPAEKAEIDRKPKEGEAFTIRRLATGAFRMKRE